MSHFARCERVSLLLFKGSVNDGHPDEISETIVCWSFSVLLTGLASKLYSPYEEEC